VRLSDYSEPQPDLGLLRPRDDFHRERHPRAEGVLLIIEVSATSLHFDREAKIPLYARHGIPEVWLVDLGGTRLVRYRALHQGSYTLVDEPDLGIALEISALAGATIRLQDLFG
jgi:Uma2 family endonuclease